MATAATSLLGLALPVTGELSGTWGNTVNVSITALLDTAVAGTTTLSSDADVTLTTTTLAANEARQAIILWTAGGTATRTITVPAQSKSYIVINKTSSSQSIKIVGAGPTTGVTIVAGTAALVVWNGVDFVTASVTSTTGVLPVANGGTGLTSGTSGGVLAYTATGTLASSTALAASALVIGGGAGVAPSTTTTGTGVVTALGVNTGSAGAFVVNGGVLGTPSSGTLTNATGLPISTGVSGLGTGIATALAVNVGTAGSPVVNGGALGSPSTAGTMPAFTLGGTVSGGGNNINNVVIGASTPLAGSFSTLNASSTSTLLGATISLNSGLNWVSLSGAFSATADSGFAWSAASTRLLYLVPTGYSHNLRVNNSDVAIVSSTGLAVTGTLSATGTLSGGTSGTGYSFSGSAPATSLTLNSSGNLGIGTSSPDNNAGYSALSISNTTGAQVYLRSTTGTVTGLVGADNAGGGLGYLATNTNHALAFRTNNIERARIDSSGNLLVGTTSTPTSGCKFAVFGSGSLTSALNSGTYTWFIGTDSNYYNFYDGGGALKGYLTNSGTFTSTSDLAYKKDITDIQYGLADVLKMRSVFYRTKDYDEPQIGFIAQEMELIVPEVVSGKEGSKGIAYGNINAVLVKAIQEQQAIITQLTARITALESA